MLFKKSLFLCSVATILLTSCGNSNPSAIEGPISKFFAASFGNPEWVGNELYDYVVNKYYTSNKDLEQVDAQYFEIFKELKDDIGNSITGDDLYEFMINGEIPENGDVCENYANLLWTVAVSGVKPDQLRIKKSVFETAYDICEGDFSPLVEKIAKQVEVFEYEIDEEESTKKVTAYAVAYKAKEYYVLCVVSDLGNEKVELVFYDSSKYYSQLGIE